MVLSKKIRKEIEASDSYKELLEEAKIQNVMLEEERLKYGFKPRSKEEKQLSWWF